MKRQKSFSPPASPGYFSQLSYHAVYNYPNWGKLYWCDESKSSYYHIPGEDTCLRCNKPISEQELPL